MNFVRDIAIPIILLLAVGAIIASVNLQLTNLLTLGGQNDILLVRNTQLQIENSSIPANLVKNIDQSNIENIVPVVIQDASVIVNDSTKLIPTTIQIVAVDLQNFTDILPFQTISSSQLANLSGNDVIIGSQIMQELNLNAKSLNSYSILNPSSNATLLPKIVMNEPDMFVNAITINLSSMKLVNQTYKGDYYSEIFMKVKDKTKIVSTANQIQKLIDKSYPQCDCQIMQGSGTHILLSNVLSEIVSQLVIFNFILDIIIAIRVIQSLFWISNEYKYELNELKIQGSSFSQIFVIFMIISFIIGNLGVILGTIGSIFVPVITTYLVSIFTNQPATIIPPTLDLIIENFFQVNILIILVSIIPAYKFASQKIIKQLSRE